MRVNVYHEEITDRVECFEEDNLTALRFYLELPATVNGKQYRGPFKHTSYDDDSSAVTFWGTPSQLHDLLLNAISELEETCPDVARSE